MAEEPPHIPVLPAETLAMADPAAARVVVDGTFGAGGHARLIAAGLPEGARYIAIDRDASALQHLPAVAADHPGVAFEARHGTFADVIESLAREGVSADVVILDVGVSSMQVDQPQRGFSYRNDAPLDMRMDQSAGDPAADIIASADVGTLTRLLRAGGAEREARHVARAIVRSRDVAPIATTADLVRLVEEAIPAALRRRRGHPAKRVFQALRIAVNDELGQLERGLDAARGLLAPGGRLCVISFHSAEDRIAKRRFRDWTRDCTCPPEQPICTCGGMADFEDLARSGIVASDDERAANPRAASARLRGVRRRP